MDFIKNIKEKLAKQTLSPKAFLSKFKFTDEAGRDSARYTDPTYISTFYYLGKTLLPKNVIEIGFGIGLVSSTLFSACAAEHFLAFEQKTKEYYSWRIGRGNVWNTLKKKFDFYYGDIYDDEFAAKVMHYKWDLVLINNTGDYEWYSYLTKLLWRQMNIDGVIVFDKINSSNDVKQHFKEVCQSNNRDICVLPTRYGLGILVR